MHCSQAFAAFRTELVANLQADIKEELLPKYNSEVEDIRRKAEDIKGTRGEALADHHKRARMMDLRVRQQVFIDELNKEMRAQLEERVSEYKGTIETKMDGDKEVMEAKFPDGSVARVPKSLWIDYKQFDRI
jgi:hypothetical protein